MGITRICSALAIWLMATVFVAGAAAEPFEDGRAAFLLGDYASALRVWRPLAEAGDASAQERLGFMYANGLGVSRDLAKAVAWYRKAADKNNAAAQSSLGFMYTYGEGVARDYVQAHMWFSLAASRGDRDAAHHRDMIIKLMTRDQINKAERLAQDRQRP